MSGDAWPNTPVWRPPVGRPADIGFLTVNIAVRHPPPPTPSRLRTLVQACVVALLAAEAAQVWLLDGLTAPCRVTGPSMAGTLLGVHRDVVCGDCGCRFCCGTDGPQVAVRAVCPNCGYAANDLESSADVDGDRVLIDRTAFALRGPRRWEVAAFRRPSQADQVFVKRIVGLPGESVEIRHGDVYVDGQIQRKSLAEQRAMAVLVYDAQYVPNGELKTPRRWSPEGPHSAWECGKGSFWHAAKPEGEAIDWLEYRHTRRDGDRTWETPVTDLCAYNVSEPRREEDVHAVADLLLSFRLSDVSGDGDLCVRMADGANTFEARLRFETAGTGADVPSAAKLDHTGRPQDDGQLHDATIGQLHDAAIGQLRDATMVDCVVSCGGIVSHFPINDSQRAWQIEASLVDRQFLLAVDGRPVAAWPYERTDPSTDPPARPAAIGIRRLAASVADVRVYRDVYYTHPIGSQSCARQGHPVRLAADEYYVLGDNSPVSVDSRTWPDRGAIHSKWLVGKPLAAIPSLRCGLGDLWHFQVPNPAGIRYIR